MTECLPDLPRYIRQFGDNEWQGADHQNGPWRPIPAPQAGLPWRTDGPAVQSREPASVAAEATGPRPLSPAAQGVMDAVCDNTEPDCDTQHLIAAALRAVADQVDAVNVPNHIRGDEYWAYRNGRAATKEHLLAIADELEGSNA